MQYSLEEIATLLAQPDQHSQKYTVELLEDLIQALYTPEQQAEVWSYLNTFLDPTLSVRIRLAAVHLSADGAGQGNLERLLQNIELANVDYRDLLMAYY